MTTTAPKRIAKPRLGNVSRRRIEAHLQKHYPNVHLPGFLLGLESAAFLGKLDREKESALHSEKERQRAMAKVRTASNNLIAAIDGLDEDAKWHFFGCVDSGQSPDSMDILSRRKSELVGYQRRGSAEAILDKLFRASTYRLPPLDKYGAQLQVAVAVSLTFKAADIEFNARGFPRMCLEETFNLAGMSFATVTYWINRAKNEAKNLP